MSGTGPLGAFERIRHRIGEPPRVPNPLKWARSLGFPYTAAPVPNGVEPPALVDGLEDNYDTEWARGPLARATRLAAVETIGRVIATATCLPELRNRDRLDGLDGPLIFVANHHSHLDTTLLMTAIPMPWRHELVVAAAADYFFDTRLKAALAGWAYGAVPMERNKISRRSADRAASLLSAGWSLLIFPEGGRSPDGWGQPHKGGAAYLSTKLGIPVVPIHIDGTGRVLPKSSRLPRPERVTVNFGEPLIAAEGVHARRFLEVIERGIDHLADETANDWWSAKQRAHRSSTASISGPEFDSWRRDWSSPERQPTQQRKRRWPE